MNKGNEKVDDRVREYWRDQLMKILSWGTATALLIIGWLMTIGEKIEFCLATGEGIRGIALVISIILVFGTWICILHKIHSKWLSNKKAETDATVLKKIVVMIYTVSVSVFTLGLSILTAIL